MGAWKTAENADDLETASPWPQGFSEPPSWRDCGTATASFSAPASGATLLFITRSGH